MADIYHIVAQCQKDIREAQKELYEFFAPRMFAVCCRYSQNRMEAEDWLHDGFLKVFDKIKQYRGDGVIEAWIRKIMVNTIMEDFRNRKKMLYVDDHDFNIDFGDEEEPDRKNSFEDVDIDHVKVLITQLPTKYRLVFNLYVIEKYSHEKIAEELGISVGTSKSNLSRARQWLKNKVMKECNIEREEDEIF
ncbi:MAG: sigma-70 family RNA polymerase sigma factor [Cytophagaceae bacterium]|jgi:RNA polymerase sigma-70 factor (ECF subfamily)|nr:sigma-70 family RNA polymerase sigma factor [Cytophagaceae bacterium]